MQQLYRKRDTEKRRKRKMSGGDELHTIKCNEWKNYDLFGGKRAIIKFDLRTKRSDFYDSASNFISFFSGSLVRSLFRRSFCIALHFCVNRTQRKQKKNIYLATMTTKKSKYSWKTKREKKSFFFLL